jgi:hypothetical protein
MQSLGCPCADLSIRVHAEEAQDAHQLPTQREKHHILPGKGEGYCLTIPKDTVLLPNPQALLPSKPFACMGPLPP